jgi:hypothetical protein
MWSYSSGSVDKVISRQSRPSLSMGVLVGEIDDMLCPSMQILPRRSVGNGSHVLVVVDVCDVLTASNGFGGPEICSVGLIVSPETVSVLVVSALVRSDGVIPSESEGMKDSGISPPYTLMSRPRCTHMKAQRVGSVRIPVVGSVIALVGVGGIHHVLALGRKAVLTR